MPFFFRNWFNIKSSVSQSELYKAKTGATANFLIRRNKSYSDDEDELHVAKALGSASYTSKTLLFRSLINMVSLNDHKHSLHIDSCNSAVKELYFVKI